jgi:autotransporter-associated beta strand protein
MIGRKLAWRMGALALATSFAQQAHAVQFTLQHTNEIDLGSYFFGPGNQGPGSPSSGYGTNPLSIAFDGTNAYIGGYNNSGTSDNAGIVEIPNVLSAALTPGIPFAATQVPVTGRGINDMAYDPVSGAVYYGVDTGSTATSFIARLNTNGTIQWQTLMGASVGAFATSNARAWDLAIDPRGNTSTNPASPEVATIFRSSGRRATFNTTTGALDAGPSGAPNPGPVILGTPNQYGNSWRSLAFDANGDMVAQTGQGIVVGVRASDTSFATLGGTTGNTSSVISKGVTFDNIGNGIAFVNGLVNDRSGIQSNLLVFAAPAGSTAQFSQSLTSVTDNSTVNIDSRQIQIRNVDGTTTGLTQTFLTGAEDDLGTAFTGDTKNFAVGTDANGLPVILSVDFTQKRLDIYSVEPTWTAGSGTLGASGNWIGGFVPNSALQNAKFPSQNGATAINVAGSFTTKDLKIDSAPGNYSFTGGGTITLSGPAGHTANFQIISGNQTIGAAVNLANAGGVDALISSGASLTITGPISGSVNLNKVGDGTMTISGDNSNSFTGTTLIAAGALVISDDKSLGNAAGNLTISGGTLIDTSGFTTSRNLVVGANGASLEVDSGTETRTGTLSGTGAFTKTGAGTAVVSPFALNNVTVAAGTLGLISGRNGAAVVSSLTVGDNSSSTTARLDLNDEDLIWNYSGSSPIDTVATLLTAGYNGGAWNGNGIGSTFAQSHAGQGLGYGDAADVGITSLDGVNITGSAVIVKYTYTGDASLDGKVDLGNDFDLFLQGYLGGGTGWVMGDFNYDGVVDTADFQLFVDGAAAQGMALGELEKAVAGNGQLSAAQKASLLAVIPEPTAAGLMMVAMVGVVGRRRKS